MHIAYDSFFWRPLRSWQPPNGLGGQFWSQNRIRWLKFICSYASLPFREPSWQNVIKISTTSCCIPRIVSVALWDERIATQPARNKEYVSETYWQTNFSSALIDIKDIPLVEPAWYPPYSENALHVFAKKPYQQRGRGEWLSIFPSKKRHFHMKTTEKNDDSILKRNRCMIFAHCSYQSNKVRFAKRTDVTQLL